MKRSITFVFALALTFQVQMAYGEGELFIPPPPPPPPVAPPPVTINNGANTGQASQNGGAGANNAAGAALIAAGTAMLPNPPTAPMGAALIALGIIALMQGAHDSNAAGQSGATGAASVFNNGQTQKNEAGAYDNGKTAFNNPTVKKAIEALKEKGYNVTEKGLSKPDGTTVPMSALQSSAGLKAAGIDPDALKKAQDIAAKAVDGYSVSSVATAGGGGGGGAAHDIGPGGGEEADGGKFDAFSLGADAQRALMAGKTKNLDGDPIGVAGANIFEMIHEAYQKKRTGDQFVEHEEAAARAPASIKHAK